MRQITRRVNRRSKFSTNVVICLICFGFFYIFYIGVFQGGISDSNESDGIDNIHKQRPVRNSIDPNILKFRTERFNKYVNRGVVEGPGEEGASVKLSSKEQKKADSLFKKEAFNIVASDKVSLERSVKDTRDTSCQHISYPLQLPTASVVIIFHNEAWSPLLRTAHSVVNRSPPELLHEVLLVDDFSDRPELGQKLVDYVYQTWPDNIVKIVRIKQRSGLIRARIAGAEAATGDVLIFLDSHCEANKGWLEPLLNRIHERRSAVLCPEIDLISADNLHYAGTGAQSVGGFWWSLHFSWRPIPKHERERRQKSTDPIRSPTMAGGLFAVDRHYFFELGGYDPGMDVWGGENLEISFRTWMCGGTLEFIPCSRVGHIFRASHPYTFPGNKDTHGLNSKRLAEVWMDEYKRLFYLHRHDLVSADAGNVTDRVQLRKNLKCKSFKWFLDNVYPEKFIPDENVFAYGMVRNPESNLCLDTMGRDEKTVFNIGLFHCQGGKSANEVFSFSKKNELRREEACLDSRGAEDSKVSLVNCHDMGGNQHWQHDKTTKTIKHTSQGRCLDRAEIQSGGEIILRNCNGDDSQKWEFEFYL